MKTIPFTYGSKTLHLYFNGNAMFALEELDKDRTDNQPEVVDRMQNVSPDGIATLCKVAVILATQGESCRRYLHYSSERVPSEEELLSLLSPLQLLGLRSAVVRAIHDGWNQTESEPDDDIDTGLAELEKKTRL